MYVTINAGERHHDFSPTISLYTSDEELSDTVKSITVKQLQAFEGGEVAKTVSKAADGTETLADKTLGELKTIIATDSEGKEYGLTTLSNFFWGKKQIGFKAPASDDPNKSYYPKHELVGKKVVKLTFVTENSIYYTDNIVSGTTTTDSTTKVITFTPKSDSSFVIENIQAK